MTAPVGPELLYEPHPDQVAHARVRAFIAWLAGKRAPMAKPF